MTGSGPSQKRSLTGPFGVAVALHIAAAAVLIFAHTGSGGNLPPPVRLKLVAAAAGPRAVGVVEPAKTAPDAPMPTKAREKPTATKTVKKPAPTPKTTKATPNVPKPETPQPKTTAAPKAGGGSVGGKGTDVANIDTEGIDFPFPGYLNNLVNQILQRFTWDGAPYTADVKFLIRRDGSIASIQVLKSSGGYAFKTEAQGAIESAGNARAFGKLPAEFTDDVLSVVFTFDPKQFRK